jgi:hypothetical protein
MVIQQANTVYDTALQSEVVNGPVGDFFSWFQIEAL